ncbi:MAG TPA: NADH-quinone oxidoreductase subunit N [Bacteroidia bacterium]|nr:NADH-quinone oxidoreductase subunit N [Bacteroidia bacterium]HRS59293.1 NADH-quinone oxidoreductase subunit N [Bacteroidia bacterium]HRU67117.1 NADH-quinone oxidoreductase subunit N [Bacteroidia bacterium]
MNLNDFLLMRHELLLTALIIAALFYEIFASNKARKNAVIFNIVLFALITLAGFLPVSTGELFGGSFHNSQLTALLKNILNIGTLIILFQSAAWLKKPENETKILEYFILIYSSLIGMQFMISSGDFLIFYIGLELATIPVAALSAFEKFKKKSAEAGIKLILNSALSSGILLYGLSMIFGSTGSVYFTDVAAAFNGNSVQIIGLIFFIVGMGFKMSLVPFHLWTADVYEGSPVSITSFLSVISKGAASFIFIIILYTVMKTSSALWKDLLYVLSILTMTIGNLFALRQNNLKRFLAFSSIAQAGFILLGILGGNQMGMTAVFYFALIYIFTNLGAFGVVAVISNTTGKEEITDYNGLYRTNPLLSLTMMLALFSLAGIPPVAGFFGKFFLFTAAASNDSVKYYILVLIAVLNATISLYYYLRVVKAMFIDKSDHPIEKFKSDIYSKIGIVLCVAGIFIIGFASLIYEYIYQFSIGL